MIISGKLISARYFANEISKLGDDKTHIWLKFHYRDEKILIVFLYTKNKGRNILYQHSSSLGAEISVSDELYKEIKNAVIQGNRDLSDVGIIIGSDSLSEELIEKWTSENEFSENNDIKINELSISINHPTYTNENKILIENARSLIRR